MSNITENALGYCLKEMLEHKTLDKITVTELVERCEIKRQTFYYHFSDIYDLVEWIYSRDTEKAIGENKTYATWTEGFNRVFLYLHSNKKFVMNTYTCVSRDYLERFLYDVVFDLMMNVIDEVSKDAPIKDEDKSFIANFYKYAFVGIVLHWIDGGMKQDKDEIIEKTHMLVEGDIEKAIANYLK